MKIVFINFILCGMSLAITDTEYIPPRVTPSSSHFVSAIQFAVHENSGPLLKRSQRLVRDKFVESVEAFPELTAVPYDVRVTGNEVVFYVMTPEDTRVMMQQAIAQMIQGLNGRVRAKGRTSFYKTDLPQPSGGYLETLVNDAHSGVVSVVAHAVPLRDLLAQLRDQLGGLSYLVPGECADRKVSWEFQAGPTMARPVDAVMTELGGLYGLKVDKRNNTHIFTGSCDAAVPVEAVPPAPNRGFPMVQVMAVGSHPFVERVYFPVQPLGQ